MTRCVKQNIMETEREKINRAKRPKMFYSAAELTRIAVKKMQTHSAMVWFSRHDGWWLETDTSEVFLGSDSKGAKRTLDELNPATL